ncbi:leucine-rich repeat-containing protein 72-like isoform X3 [Huso huso]|uniref:Leucine-rich repeat-containing protein 72-like isoform X3 n=1 Tax=Huso huso TaxID=61971 RepID=A0ABR1AAJ1_HUSHU
MLGLRCLSFAYQDLEEIPYISILQHQDTLEVLDLSYNLLEDPALLGELEKLTTLILDCNNYTSHVKFPFMPSVTTVWINKNKIKNLPTFVEEVRRKFPNIRQYVISQIPGLEVLDDKEVLEEERIEAQNVYKLQRSSVFKKKKDIRK